MLNIYLCAFSLVTLLNIGTSMYNVALVKRLTPPAPRQYTYVGDDYPAQLQITLPPVGHAHLDGAPQLNLLDDEEWGLLFPTDGFSVIGPPPDNRTFQLSMIHQLHCLDVIRVEFVTRGPDAEHHIQHCLRYLVQSVLCNADATLEEDLLGQRYAHAASGVGMVHRCKDWRVLMKFIADHPTEAWLVGELGEDSSDSQ